MCTTYERIYHVFAYALTCLEYTKLVGPFKLGFPSSMNALVAKTCFEPGELHASLRFTDVYAKVIRRTEVHRRLLGDKRNQWRRANFDSDRIKIP